MKLKFIQSDEIYSINLPSPDFHVHLKLKGFKKVLARSSAVEDLYLYGSFFDIKIYQPEINKTYFNESLRGVTQVKIPKKQSKVYDWRKYYYNMETFFNNFSKSIEKPNKKWLKETTENNIKKDLQIISSLIPENRKIKKLLDYVRLEWNNAEEIISAYISRAYGLMNEDYTMVKELEDLIKKLEKW